MNRREIILKAKSIVLENLSENLIDVIKKTDEPVVLVSSLLYACGFSYVNVEIKGEHIIYSAGNSESDITEKVIFNEETKKLTGVLEEEINRLYKIVDLIENRLTSSVALYPVDKRIEKINILCKESGISSDDYEKVLRNWN
ncbi:hypothetical protein H0178_15510 [Cytobacillus firmus]|nr:hypothetical protein [Cytobacillus firmus]